MKHAFLIIAHENWWQLKQLILMLDDADNDMYIHIDRKASDFDEREFYDLTKYSHVHFYREYDVYNGNPYTFTSDDFELITSSEMLFARKFNEKTDRIIISRVRDYVVDRDMSVHKKSSELM